MWEPAPQVYRVQEMSGLPSELYCYPRSGGDVGSCGRVLLPGDTTADGVNLETNVFGRFNCAAYGFPHKRWNLNSALFDIQNDRTACGQGCLGLGRGLGRR